MFIQASSIRSVDFGGLSVRDYTAELQGRSSVAEIIAPPRSSHPPALSRRSDKLYWVLEGSLWFEIDGAAATLGTCDLAIVPQGMVFSYRTGDEQARMLLVHTPPFDAGNEVFI